MSGDLPGDLPPSAAERVIEVLVEHGDALTTVREIDHFSYFPEVEARARYVDKCLAAGFKLRRLSEPYKPGAGFGAIVFHDDVPDEEVLLKVHAMLTDLAAAEGGEYDGWETQVMV